jgi:serine/threonine protein kinase
MMRDVVLGLEYLHFQGIIHRDIKPGNLLISNNGTVKISDFGVSHLATVDHTGSTLPENDHELAKTAGSPAFFAPEICRVDQHTGRANITKAIDVWALGVTFYCLLFGREPFPDVRGEMELFDKICTAPIEIPPDEESRIDKDTKDLLYRLLEKNISERITLYQVRRHPFITKDIPDPKKWAEETDLCSTCEPLQVTYEEVESAIGFIGNIVRRTIETVKMTAKRSMSLLRNRQTGARVITGVSSPSSPQLSTTLPSNPASPNPNKEAFSSLSKSDMTENRPKFQHSYFYSGVSAMDIPPPTPPDSGKVDAVLPVQNQKVNGYPSLTPPTSYTKPEPHLKDDYSNIYYSDDSEEFSEIDEDEDDRLEMNFGRKK